MKVLFVSSSVLKKGSASVRNLALINGLREQGMEVDVLTLNWPEHMNDSFFKENLHRDVTVYRDNLFIIDKYYKVFKKSSKKSGGGMSFKDKLMKKIRQAVLDFFYFPSLDKEWIKSYSKKIDYSRYSIIISSSDTKTSHCVVEKLRQKYDFTWVQYWGDPWYDDAGTKGIRRVRAFFWEKRLLSKGDLIAYASPPTMESCKKRYYREADKMMPLERGFLKEILSRKRDDGDKIIMTYIGSIYYGRNINYLLDAVKEYNITQNKQIELRVYGILNGHEELLSHYDFIKINGYISYKEVLDVTAESDILLFLGNMADSHQIPGKLYDFMGTDKTVLALLENMESPVADYINSLKRCIVFPNSAGAINITQVVNSIGDGRINESYSGKNIARKLLYKAEVSL